MKNLLLLLLLANILYFLWGRFTEPSPEPGVAIVDESELGPPLSLTDAPQVATSVGAMLGSGAEGSTDLAAVVGRSCVSIGPFTETADAERVLADYRQENLRATLRTTQGEIFVGHWVQIPDIANRTTANNILQKLTDGGLSDAYLIPMDDGGMTISLGLFGDVTRAERVELQAESLNLHAEITPRTREATVFFVDIALPPVRGAGAMIERYGEDKVLLRGAATCPRAN
jgi:hypothetical protein